MGQREPCRKVIGFGRVVILRLVTGSAVRALSIEHPVTVAIQAESCLVRPRQRKVGPVMIEVRALP